jgi:hypothetical protein
MIRASVGLENGLDDAVGAAVEAVVEVRSVVQ